MIWYIVALIILILLFILTLFHRSKGKTETVETEIVPEKKKVYEETKKPISYLFIVSEVLKHFREFHKPEDIIKHLGAECLIESIEESKTQLSDESWQPPEGSEQKAFRFRESQARNVTLEVVFYQNQLINFRARIYLFDLNTRRISEFTDSYLYPLISEIVGSEDFQYNSSIDTYYYDNFKGLIIGVRAMPENLSVSTQIMDKVYA